MAKVGCLALCASVIQHAASNKMDSSGVKVLVDDTNPLISYAFFGAAVDQWGQSFKLRTHGAVHTCVTPTSSGHVILSDCDKTERAQCFKYKRDTKMLQAFGLGSSSDTFVQDCLHTEEKGTAPTLDLLSCDSCGAEDCRFIPSMPDKLGYFSLSALGGKLEAGTGYLSFVDNNANGTAVRFYSDYEENCKDDSPKVQGSGSGEATLADTPIAHQVGQAIGQHAHAQAERMMKLADAASAELSAASPTTAHSESSMMAEAEAAAAEVSSVSAKTETKKTQPMLRESSDDLVASADDAAQDVIGKMSKHHARGVADAAAKEAVGQMHSDDAIAKGLNEQDDALAQGLNEKADDAHAQGKQSWTPKDERDDALAQVLNEKADDAHAQGRRTASSKKDARPRPGHEDSEDGEDGSKSELETLANLALARKHKKA